MQTIYRKVRYYGHCATICPIDYGILLAYYSGPECADEQRVHVEYWIKGRLMSSIILPEKTGNCVLVPTSKEKVTLIFSHFEDTDGVERITTPVTRWRFCSNWAIDLHISRHRWIEHTEIERFQALPEIGALVRCNPIKFNNKILLPAYKEHNCYGIVLEYSKGKWTHLSDIGHGKGILIQPTLWSKDNVLHSLSRDITGNRKAWYSKSTDGGRSWMAPTPTTIDNYNNSIVVIDGTDLVVWNKGMDRNNLQLGWLSADYQSASPILKLNISGGGSYPNYCVCEDRIEIVHTEMKAASIVRHIINKGEINCLPSLLPSEPIFRPNDEDKWDSQVFSVLPEPEFWRSNEAL